MFSASQGRMKWKNTSFSLDSTGQLYSVRKPSSSLSSIVKRIQVTLTVRWSLKPLLSWSQHFIQHTRNICLVKCWEHLTWLSYNVGSRYFECVNVGWSLIPSKQCLLFQRCLTLKYFFTTIIINFIKKHTTLFKHVSANRLCLLQCENGLLSYNDKHI